CGRRKSVSHARGIATTRDNRFGKSLANRLTPALLEIERRGDFSNSLANCRDDRVRESQLASRACKCLESSALSAAFRERRTASNTASGEISLMHLRPVRHTPL